MSEIIKKIVFIGVFSTTLIANEIINIGILYDKVFENKDKAEIAIKVFLKQIKDKKYGHDFKIDFYTNGQRLLSDYKNKDITNIVIDTGFYFKNKEFIDKYKEEIWGMSQSDEIFDEYYLIKNLDGKANFDNTSIKNIYYNDESQKVWLEYLIYKNKEYKNKSIILKKLRKEQKANKNLLKVFFNKDSISVVTKDLYNSMLKINPQIKKQVVIIKKSKQIFLSAIGFTRKDLNNNFYKASILMNNDYGKGRDSSKVFAFANIKKVYFFKNDNPKLKQLRDFYIEYFNLIK